ncbi:MAG: GlsB/YeaQ/YmgE family stress response membrane protein [Caldilineaceae bacterium]|nr:GlsB/YeaQ/YmgE family stress response membrane protein [Caldilineaceae bacterium]
MWLIIGALLGAIVAGILIFAFHKPVRATLLLNLGVGIAGAFIAGWLISPLLTIPVMDDQTFNLPATIVAVVGSLIFLAIANFARRGTVR